MKISLITTFFPPIIGGVSFSSKCLFDVFKQNNHILKVFIFDYKHDNNIIFHNDVISYIDFKKLIPRNLFKVIINLCYFFSKIFMEKYSFRNKLSTIFKTIKNAKLIINLFNFYESIKRCDINERFNLFLAYNMKYPSYIGYFLKKKMKKKFICIAHGNDIIGKNQNVITKMLLNSADKIVVRSNFIKNIIVNKYKINPKKINIIPDGIILNKYEITSSKSELRKSLNLSPNNFYIISVGLLSLIRKSFDLVLKGLKDLRDVLHIDISNIEYILIGRDDKKVREWLTSLAIKYGLKDNFRILVNINDDLRNKYYKASDIFVMPSRNLINKGSIEGFGNSFIEAGYYYLPSIGSNTGGIPDAIENGKSGLLVNDYNELVEKIKILYNDKDLRQKLGNYAHNRVLNSFTWQKIYNLYLRTFKS